MHATTHPHRASIATPMYLQPRMQPGIWFHDLPPLATIHGAIVATDAGTTPAGMAMAPAYEHAPGQNMTVTTSGMGTSQEGEALTLLLCVRLVTQQGIYWMVPDLESAISALRTYQEGGQCRDGIYHLYARTMGVEHLAPTATIIIVVTPSHWKTAINVQVDTASREEPQADLAWMPRHPYTCLPRVKFQDHCQLAPTDL